MGIEHESERMGNSGDRMITAMRETAARLNGINYSQLMHGLKVAGIELDRKVLADLAVNQPEAFAAVALQAKNALDSQKEKAAA